MLAPYLNETARFVQNNGVSCKKKRAERCRFEQHCSAFFFPWTRSRGRKKLLFFFFNSSCLSLSPHASVKNPKPNAPSLIRPRESRPASHTHWPPRLAPQQGRKWPLPMHSDRAAIGTPPLPLPYKYHPTPVSKGRENKRKTQKKKRKHKRKQNKPKRGENEPKGRGTEI